MAASIKAFLAAALLIAAPAEAALFGYLCTDSAQCGAGHACVFPSTSSCGDGLPLVSFLGDCSQRPACCGQGMSCIGGARCLPSYAHIGVCEEATPAPPAPVDAVSRFIDNRNGLQVHYLEAGVPQAGPLVVFLHGFPELAESWRAQVEYFGAQGFWCVAPDLRGFGNTTGDGSLPSLQVVNMVRDIVGLVQALGAESAVLVGHDLGAFPAFFTALFRQDIIRGVAVMSFPLGAVPKDMTANPFEQDLLFEQLLAQQNLTSYQSYLRSPQALQDSTADPRRWLRNIYHIGSAAFSPSSPFAYPLAYPVGGSLFDRIPADLPEDPRFAELLDMQEAFFAGGGAEVPLRYYQVAYQEVQIAFAGSNLAMPYAFFSGEAEFVFGEAALGSVGSKPRDPVRIPSSGHWVHHENSDGTTGLLEGFLQGFL